MGITYLVRSRVDTDSLLYGIVMNLARLNKNGILLWSTEDVVLRIIDRNITVRSISELPDPF